MSGSRPLRSRVISIALIFAALAITALSYFIINSLRDTEFKPDPSVQLSNDKNYILELWIPSRLSTFRGIDLKAYIKEKCDEFKGKYNNVTIRIKEFQYSRYQEALEKAAASGAPPDIALCLDGTFADYGELQIPIDGYLSEDERTKITKAAIKGVSSGRGMIGWPLGLGTELWIVNTLVLQGAGIEPQDWLSGQLRLGELFELASENKKAIALLEPTVGLLDQFFADGRRNVDPIHVWSPKRVKDNTDLLLKAADDSGDFIATGFLPGFARGSILTMAPVRMALVNFLVGLGSEGSENLLFLPGPVAAAKGYMPAEVDAAVVFRQKRFKGHDYLRAAVELARLISLNSSELCNMLLHYPAEKSQSISETIGGKIGVTPRLICSCPIASSELSLVRQRIGKDIIPYLIPGNEARRVTDIIDKLNNVQAVIKRTYSTAK